MTIKAIETRYKGTLADLCEQAGVECRELPDFPGYAFGADGSVWSRWKVRTWRHGLGTFWRRLAYKVHPRYGYATVILKFRGTLAQKTMRVSRLILLAFVGPPPAGHEACHENGVKLDNRKGNLSWGTHKKNIADKRRHGTHRMTGGKKLTDEQAVRIRELHASGKYRQRDLGEMFGVNRATISYLLSGKTWRDV